MGDQQDVLTLGQSTTPLPWALCIVRGMKTLSWPAAILLGIVVEAIKEQEWYAMVGNLDHVIFESQQASIKFLFQILLAVKTLMIARRTTFAETTTVMTSLVTVIQQLIVVFQVLQLSIICFCV